MAKVPREQTCFEAEEGQPIVEPVKVRTFDSKFIAGRLSSFIHEWKALTSDTFVLDMVKGTKIPIEDFEAIKNIPVKKNQIKDHEHDLLDLEIDKLCEMGVLEETDHEEGEVINPVFLREKSDGTYRMILNLKTFNESVEYSHFKMENLNSATRLMKKGAYMASIDLKHAYYSVPIHISHRKYLKLKHKGRLLAFTAFPNGACFCPRYFTNSTGPNFGT